MIEILFYLAIFLIVYTYAIYPFLLYFMSRNIKENRGEGAKNPVAIICALHNEKKIIAQKIENFYELEYDDIQLFLGLDGCTDNTKDEILKNKRDNRIRLFTYNRMGKANVINNILKEVRQPFVVMTDANSMFKKDAVQKLLAEMNKKVGVVCGRLILKNEEETKNTGESIYWQLETFIKNAESKFGSVIGANGAIYLFRRELFQPLPPYTINDDFLISMRIYDLGYKIVYAPNAIAEEKNVTSEIDEFRRHIRDGAGHFRAIWHLKSLLNPIRMKQFFFFTSHRVIRWSVPFLLLIVFILNVLLSLDYRVYKIILALHLIFYSLIISVHFARIRWKPLYIAYYFMLVNLAILIGFLKNIFGLQKTIWNPTRR